MLTRSVSTDLFIASRQARQEHLAMVRKYLSEVAQLVAQTERDILDSHAVLKRIRQSAHDVTATKSNDSSA